MSDYFLAPCLGSNDGAYSDTGLFGEINARYRDRDHSSDGWIGDPSHAARTSDHNPDWNENGRLRGVVRAIDVDTNGGSREVTPLARDLLKAAIGDPRVWYVIFASKLYSRTYGWSAKRYTGSNPHDHHVHISLRHGYGEFDTSNWLSDPPIRVLAKPVSLSRIRRQFLASLNDEKLEVTNGVARIQRTMVKREGFQLTIDGLAGPKTLNAWGEWEKDHPALGRPRIPDRLSLAAFAQGRFEVIP